MATRFGSRLTVVSVVDPLLAEAARVRLGQDLAKQETEPALREFAVATRASAIPATTQIVFRTVVGDAASSILETAEGEGADLIVMGTQGLGGFRKYETRVGSARVKLHALAEQICGSQKCDEVVALGRPADLISSIAVDRRARLIVRGLRASKVRSHRPGSIAYRVLSSTTVPVLVVPAS